MIIAEIGQNFMGDMELAKQLIRLAEENGADKVKFQLYDHNLLYKDHPEIPNVELSFDQAKMLFDYGGELGIEVFFSVFDVERVKWCEEIGVKRYKIACNMRDTIVLWQIGYTDKPFIISLDPEFEDLTYASMELCHTRAKNVKYLYCKSLYPTKISQLDFKSFVFSPYYGTFNGFSDHTIGLDAAKIALARGAKIIEKHFSLDKQTGVDAQWSMTPEELKELRRWADVCVQCL